MTTPKDQLVSALGSYLDSLRSEASTIRSRLAEIDRELSDLGGWKDKLAGAGVQPPPQPENGRLRVGAGGIDPAQVSQAITPVAVNGAATDPARVTVTEVHEAALTLLREAGTEGMKAVDIAKRIAPKYDPESDNRNFENRVFSILKRRSEFVKMGRGNWVLRELLTEHPLPSWGSGPLQGNEDRHDGGDLSEQGELPL